ncbi:aldehyde dehydrogenase family protein [Parasphingopyxis marina]|uniref:Aldehyde dehydrogenase family protein n=1 Tax=Parasphingopyxis marina TaxID=2761622 RepID=A0A842I426_9SPHN|nr:aldehyde dehydrogenase family protein [Parasphingopyxis marina]MBC2778874.1 aldehyde dehydrogenase family protein [Parasphingopyxis marina]
MTGMATAQAAEIPSLKEARAFAAGKHRLFIGGQWVDAQGGESFATYDPATGGHLADVAKAGAADVDAAVRAARGAMDDPAWLDMKPSARARLLNRLADALEEYADEFAVLETLDNGKPVGDARNFDIPYATEMLRYYAGWATKLNGETISLSGPGTWHAYTLREPVGVVAQIVPWNAPIMMAVAKIAPALAAGCAVILKPAEETPLTALRLAHLIAEIGFPDGAFNLLTGFGETAGAALTEHDGVDKVTFTGSTEVGRHILKAAAGNFKRVTLELGGKTPVIVLPDADIASAIQGAARSIFTNAGQVCNAGSRLFVHRSNFDAVVDGVAEIAASLKLGSGLDTNTQMGPVISGAQRDRVRDYIRGGVDEGATLRAGGGEMDGTGYFVPPTVLTDTDASMAVRREEIFGPVLCVMAFGDDDLDRIAAEANDSNYGLGAVLWTNNLSAAHKLAKKLKAGTVRVNGGGLDPALPFGGFKQSGWGRENGREGIEAYTETKSVAMAL